MVWRPPPTPAVVGARRFAAGMRVLLAAMGAVLLAADPSLHPHPVAAGIGLLVLAVTGLVHGYAIEGRWLSLEEAVAVSAGALLVTLGPSSLSPLTLIWLVSVGAGVVARGGRRGMAGRVLVGAVLLSPLVRYGVTAVTISLPVSGAVLLLVVGRISVETAQLLRDPLTGCMWRAGIHAHADRLAARADHLRPVTVVMIDLDDFGAINKQRGHQAGDALLVATVDAIQNGLGESDMLGRVGGDEFAILTDRPDTNEFAGRTLADINALGVGASAGIAQCPRDGDDAPTLLASADLALRMSKREGKGRVTPYPGPALADITQTGARNALLRLCSGDGLSAALHPIVDLVDGHIFGYEALARFDAREAPDAPQHWLALAELFGHRAALERACLGVALERLHALDVRCVLAVNLAFDMIDDREVQERIAQQPGRDRVLIEVTNTRPVSAEESKQEAIADLRASGVRVCIHETNHGQASLHQVATVRPDYFKLDQAAIRSLSDPTQAAGARLLASYVEATGCRVIAPGVESVADLLAVRAAGIRLAQGNYFGRPQAVWSTADLDRVSGTARSL